MSILCPDIIRHFPLLFDMTSKRIAETIPFSLKGYNVISFKIRHVPRGTIQTLIIRHFSTRPHNSTRFDTSRPTAPRVSFSPLFSHIIPQVY